MNQQYKDSITSIYEFNKQAGLLDNEYDSNKESCFPIEEMLETYDVTSLCNMLDVDEDYTPKNLSRTIIKIATNNSSNIPIKKYTKVDYLDKHLDTIVFSFGSIFKLGLTVKEALQALDIVMEANMHKLSVGKDSHGKQMKPKNFISPEAKLQELLDKSK